MLMVRLFKSTAKMFGDGEEEVFLNIDMNKARWVLEIGGWSPIRDATSDLERRGNGNRSDEVAQRVADVPTCSCKEGDN